MIKISSAAIGLVLVMSAVVRSAVAAEEFGIQESAIEFSLASDTAWTLSCDDGPVRPIKVTAGGWNSDRQSPQIPSAAVKNNVVYERQIAIPAEAKDRAVLLQFGGCNYGAEVWLDDTKITEHTGPMTPFEADLSGVAEPGGTYRLRVKAYTRTHYVNPTDDMKGTI